MLKDLSCGSRKGYPTAIRAAPGKILVKSSAVRTAYQHDKALIERPTIDKVMGQWYTIE
jgi:hypothetical protein